MYYVYILQSLKDSRTYVGYTANLDRRLSDHNSGRVRATKYRVPFKIMSFEKFDSMVEAKKRELWWKSGAGRRKLKELFND